MKDALLLVAEPKVSSTADKAIDLFLETLGLSLDEEQRQDARMAFKDAIHACEEYGEKE